MTPPDTKTKTTARRLGEKWLCGALAAGFSETLTMPLDVAKTRLQLQNELATPTAATTATTTTTAATTATIANIATTTTTTPTQSFLETRAVEIVDDEMCYGSTATESFTALILERPLMGRGDVPRLKDGVTPLYDGDRDAAEWRTVMEEIARSDPVTKKVIERCDRLASKIPQVFANVIDSQDVEDATDDLHEASQGLAQTLVTSKFFVHACHVNRLFNIVTEALESMVCSSSYSDTFGIYCDFVSKPERVLMAELFRQRERGWRPKELQGELANIQMTRSISYMYRLNDARSPLAKLQCIHQVIRSIMEDVSDHSSSGGGANGSGGDANGGSEEKGEDIPTGSTTVIAADELLPLLITTICEAALPCLLANTLYMREMSSERLRETKLGYALAMFEAAVAFIGRRVWTSVTEELGDRDYVSGVSLQRRSSFDEVVLDESTDVSMSSSTESGGGDVEKKDDVSKQGETTTTTTTTIESSSSPPRRCSSEEASEVFRKLCAAADSGEKEGVKEVGVKEVAEDDGFDPLLGLETRERAPTAGRRASFTEDGHLDYKEM